MYGDGSLKSHSSRQRLFYFGTPNTNWLQTGKAELVTESNQEWAVVT